MALKKPAGSTQAGQFEDDAGTVTQDAPTTDPAKASAEATTAVATASASSSRALAVGSKFVDVFKSLENALPAMDFGTLPKLVGASGGVEAKLNGGKTVDLGKAIVISLISFRTAYTISPGDDSKEAKAFVAYSDDNVVISKPDERAGKKVAEYLEQLKTVEGYEDAASKRYVYLTGIVESAEGSQDLIGQVVEVSLSPGAVRDWDGYRFQRSAAVATGRMTADGAERVQIRADKRSGNGNNWTSLVVEAPK